ncbi:MAG: class I SAM-dependent methyltransferase [Burkholderiales bacterium]
MIRNVLALALWLFAGSALALEPIVGQEGKDVVWVPTIPALVEKMLDLARVTPQDFVMDLGSGDGRTVIAAAKRGAHALGIEYEEDMVQLSRVRAKEAGVAALAEFRRADLFDTDFSQATVITMFLLPEINRKLRPTLLKLKPGTRIVTNTFTMGEWAPDEVALLGQETGCAAWCKALLWIVPAQVAGSYALPQGQLELRQEFQMLSGTLARGGERFAIQDGRVRGSEVSFRAGGKSYQGRFTAGKLVLQ